MGRAAGLGVFLALGAVASCEGEKPSSELSPTISRSSVAARVRFDLEQQAGPALLGPELALGESVAVAQDGQHPSFAAGPDLSLIVSNMGPGTAVQGIQATRVGRDGAVLDPGGILLSASGEGPFLTYGFSPLATWVGDRFFVAYNHGFEIKGVFVAADGSPGLPFTVVTNDDFNRDEILLGLASDGESVMLLWTDFPKLYCRRISRDGAMLADTEISPSLSYFPAALAYGDQQYLVVGSTDGGPAAVRLNRNGVVLDSQPLALGVPTAKATNVAVAWHAPRFLVAWSDSRNAATGPDIYAARIALDGSIADADGVAVVSSSAREVVESISAGDSAFLMTFRVEDDVPPLELRATRLSFDGRPLGALSDPIATYGSEVTGGSSTRTSVASWDGVQHWVAWPGIRGIRVQDDGTLRDSASLQLSKRWATELPRFISPTTTEFYLTWYNGIDERANRLSTAGTLGSSSGFALPAIGVPAGLDGENVVFLSTVRRCVPTPSGASCHSFPTDLNAQRTTLTGEVLTPAPQLILTSGFPFSVNTANMTWNGSDAFLLQYNCSAKLVTQYLAPFGPDYVQYCSQGTIWDTAAFVLSKGATVDVLRMDGTVAHQVVNESSNAASAAAGDSRDLVAFSTETGDVYASFWTPGLVSRLGSDHLVSDRPGASAVIGATWTGANFVIFWKEQREGTRRFDLLAARVLSDGTVLDQGGFLVDSNREFANERVASLNGASAIMYQVSDPPSSIGLRARVRLLWSDGAANDGGSVTLPRGRFKQDAGPPDGSIGADSGGEPDAALDATIDVTQDSALDSTEREGGADSGDATSPIDDATPSDVGSDALADANGGATSDSSTNARDAMADAGGGAPVSDAAGGGAPASDAARADAARPLPPATEPDEGCACRAATKPAGAIPRAALLGAALLLYSARQRSRRRIKAPA